MTSKNLLKNNSFLTSNIISTVEIKFNMSMGALDGNIIEIKNKQEEIDFCNMYSFDFVCKENSEYIPLL